MMAVVASVRKPESAPVRGTRLFAGALVFGLAQLAPLTIPLIIAMELPAGWTTALSTVMMLGVPEAGILLGAAILGREGFAWLKGKIFGLLKRALPPDQVGPVRHRIGITLFVLPFLLGWLLPYLEVWNDEFLSIRPQIYIIGDCLLLISLCVLGGNFWDKLRGLFLRRYVISRQDDPYKSINVPKR